MDPTAPITRQQVARENLDMAMHVLLAPGKLASDKETDTLGGAILKACHNGATRVIEEMHKRENPFERFGNGDTNFTGYSQTEFRRE